MGQIHGAATAGSWDNTAIVDSDGFLYTAVSGDLVGVSGNIQIYNGTVGPATIDKSTHATNTIDYEHHEVHGGGHYFVRGKGEIASSGGSTCFVMETPAGSKWTHLLFSVYSNNYVDYEEYETVTYSGGTAVAVYNSNRNSPSLYSGSVFVDPTVTATGSLLSNGFFGAPGTSPTRQGVDGAFGRGTEIILKSGTAYLWCFKVGGNNTKFGYDAEFYEHADKTQQF